jgi:glycerol-3-phosphate acyltransferase PlsX
MRMALEAVAEGRADAVISAGNTGALMALSKMILKMIPGVRRPAITAMFPSYTGSVIMLDLGATLECDAATLYQFGLMGSTFAQTVLGWNTPSVGLLNVGEEHQKGHEELKEAAALMAQDTRIHYTGFLESNHISQGRADVVVTDGFTGNVALKMAEGTADLINKMTKRAFQHTPLAKLGYVLARPAFAKLRGQLDPRRYNGAVFLGLQKTVIKSHGRSDAVGTATAIGVAVDMIQYKTIPLMIQRFTEESPLPALPASVPQPQADLVL